MGLLMRKKRAQGISINAIIIAALALVVLVVLFAVFTGRFGIFSRSLNECTGTCTVKSLCTPPSAVLPDKSCGGKEGVVSSKDSYGGLIIVDVSPKSNEIVCCLKLS
ncbi:hypothetical protein HYX02_01990 [Candidatus Woesearchaeota archaeon]|nr:hypothetical protein [Candidatus Woesearchaeota archaeon]